MMLFPVRLLAAKTALRPASMLCRRQITCLLLLAQRTTPQLPPMGAPKAPLEPSQDLPKHPILDRIPRFLRRYAGRFINAPVSHVSAFLILHELTAIMPLIGIWYFLHHNHDMIPTMDLPSWALEKGTKVIDKSMEKFDFSDYSLHDKAQIIVEGAYAYVVVKALFPVRLGFSLALMPLFAKWVILPITRLFGRKQEVEEKPAVKLKKVEKPRL